VLGLVLVFAKVYNFSWPQITTDRPAVRTHL